MKKIFTLIAAALMTLGANAQKATYAMQEGETHAAGETVDVKLGDEVVATLTFGFTGGADFKAAKADNHVEGFTAYTEGNGENGNADSGTNYIIRPKHDGTIEVAVVLNADKTFFVLEDETALADYNGIKEAEKVYKTYSFDVKGGKEYKVYCTGSKLGFYGFNYTTGEAGGDEPAPTGNVAGIYRPLDLTNLEVGDCSVAEAFGVKVTPIRGTATTYREEAKDDNSKDASDLYLGYSVTDAPKDNKAASAVYAADEVIFPFVAEQSARQEDEFFGFTMEIPEGKAVNIDEIDAYLLAGNAYQWQIELTDGTGNVVYKTQDKGIKINNYNKTAYTNGVHVTTTEVTEPTWSQEILESWSLALNYDVTDTEVLPELKNLTGTYTVKVFYWGKWQKNLTYANVSLILSEGTATGIDSVVTETAVKNDIMYNIAGQRISAPVRGQIYIMNGKKYIAK